MNSISLLCKTKNKSCYSINPINHTMIYEEELANKEKEDILINSLELGKSYNLNIFDSINQKYLMYKQYQYNINKLIDNGNLTTKNNIVDNYDDSNIDEIKRTYKRKHDLITSSLISAQKASIEMINLMELTNLLRTSDILSLQMIDNKTKKHDNINENMNTIPILQSIHIIQERYLKRIISFQKTKENLTQLLISRSKDIQLLYDIQLNWNVCIVDKSSKLMVSNKIMFMLAKHYLAIDCVALGTSLVL